MQIGGTILLKMCVLSEHQRHELNNNGFEFEIEWVS